MFFRNTLFNFVARILGTGANALTLVIVARTLGPGQQGEYVGATLFPLVLSAFCGFAFNNATVRLIGQKKYSAEVILGQNILFAGATSFVGLVIGLIILFLYGHQAFPHNDKFVLLLALASLPGLIYVNLLSHVLLGLKKIAQFSYVNASQPLFMLLSVGTLWVVAPEIITVKFLLLLQVLVGVFVWGLAYFLCIKHVGGVNLSLNIGFQKVALKFGAIVYAASLISILDDRIGMFIINLYLRPEQLGHYSVAVRLAEGLSLISIAMANVLFPISASEDSEQNAVRFSCLVCRASVLATSLVALGLWVIAPYVVSMFFADSYLSAVVPFRILLLGMVAMSAWRILANDLIARSNPVPITIIAAVSLVVNAIMGTLLVFRYGILGVAWSVTLVYFVRLVLTAIYYSHATGVPFKQLFIPSAADYSIYMSVLSAIKKRVFSARGYSNAIT